MYEVLKASGQTGGFNFDAKTRCPSFTAEDMFHAYILGMDTFALGLIKAAALIEDGRIDAFVKNRYVHLQDRHRGQDPLRRDHPRRAGCLCRQSGRACPPQQRQVGVSRERRQPDPVQLIHQTNSICASDGIKQPSAGLS